MKPSRTSHKPLSLAQLREWIVDVRDILFDCQISLRNISALNAIPTAKKGLEQFRGGFGLHLRHQHWFVLITQLDKLYSSSSNQERSFVHLFESLLAHPMHASMDVARPPERKSWDDPTFGPMIASIEKQLPVRNNGWGGTKQLHSTIHALRRRSKPLTEAMRKVTIARNNITAHTAIRKTEIRPSLDECAQLVDAAISILNTLERKANGRRTSFRHLSYFEVDWVIDQVEEAFDSRERVKRAWRQRGAEERRVRRQSACKA